MSEQVLAQLNYIKSSRDAIVNSMAAKGLQVDGSTPMGQLASYIDQLPHLGEVVYDKNAYSDAPVAFYDYDGTVLYEYTKEEFLALSALPALPTNHTGLTAQEWNWDLQDAKDYITDYEFLDIGVNYITTSGATEIFIELTQAALQPYLGIGLNGTATIDWGDNSAIDTITGTSLTTVLNTQHTYAQAGNYTITLTISQGNARLLGNNYGSYLLWANINSNSFYSNNSFYRSAIREIHFGTNIELGNYALSCCRNLSYVTIPNTLVSFSQYSFYQNNNLFCITISKNSSINSYSFYDCRNLCHVCFSKNCSFVSNYQFSRCRNLFRVSLPLITAIPNNLFSYCWNLSKVSMPNTITSIGGYSFTECYSLQYIKFSDILSTIGAQAFTNTGLHYIELPSTITSLNNAFYTCQQLQHVKFLNISSSILTDLTAAFRYCSSLKEIELPSTNLNMTSAFESCYSLTEINIPESVTAITSAFGNCQSLQRIHIPKDITALGSYVGCYSLSVVDLSDHEFVPTITSGAFNQTPPGMKIYVPSSLLSEFQSATNWSAYASQMVGV